MSDSVKVNDSRNAKLVSGIIFIFFGLFMLFFAIGNSINYSVKKENWIHSIAIITEIDHNKEKIIFTYTYKDENYVINSSIYSSNKKIGDSIVIFINPNNPSEIYEYELINVSNIFFVIGTIFTVVAFVLLVSYYKFIRKKKFCLEHGKKKTVEVDLIKKTSVRMNHRYYFIIFINYNSKEYKSHYFLMPRIFDLTTKKTVDLYIYDEKTYYIDVCSLKEKSKESDILEY